jgi:hypothetical protein
MWYDGLVRFWNFTEIESTINFTEFSAVLILSVSWFSSNLPLKWEILGPLDIDGLGGHQSIDAILRQTVFVYIRKRA